MVPWTWAVIAVAMVLVRKPHAKRNERRAITLQPGARGGFFAPLKIKNEVL
jgi:hypothetical protein